MSKNIKLIKLTLLLASMMTMMSGAIVAPCLPQINEFFKDIPNADLLTRLIITLPAIFIAGLSPVVGIIIDKFGRKRMLFFSLCLYAISGTTGWYIEDLYLILLGRVFLGISVAGIMTTSTTLVSDYFEGEERSSFVGMLGAFTGIGGMVFIISAGILADINWQLPFSIYLFSVPVLALAIAFIVEPEIKSRQVQNEQAKSDVATPSRALIFGIYLIVLIGIMFFFMVPIQIPYILEEVEGVSSMMVGMAIGTSTLSGAVVAMNLKRIKRTFSFPMMFFFAYLFIGLGYYAISLTSAYSHVVGSLMISGLGTGLMMPTGSLWIMHIAPAHRRGVLIGNLTTAMMLGMFVSPIVFQPIINATNLHTTFRIAGIAMAVIAAALLTFSLIKKSKANQIVR